MKSSSKTIISSLLVLIVYLVNYGYQSEEKSKNCDKSRKILSENHGFIENTATLNSNYTQNTHCEWLIDGNFSFISLTFNHMDTECGYDYVFVYDGSSMQGILFFLSESHYGQNLLGPILLGPKSYLWPITFVLITDQGLC